MLWRALLAGAIALALSISAAAQDNQGTSPLSGRKGGTGNAFMQFTGPATSIKTYALPNASDTIATIAAAQTLTNKTFNCANNTCTMRIGSDVTGLGIGIATFLAAPSSANFRAALTDETGTGIAYFVGGALGTPSSVTLTNATGLPVSTGISGLGTGVATALATPSSANVAAAVTDETGSGALVFGTSPALTTPNLGTPSAATLTNATGLPVSTGISGLGTGIATFLATPSSANFRAALTDETGPGIAYFVGGALGTPSSATLTNATGLPVSSGISGLGTGVATALATPSSANVAAAVADETGSGALVFGTSPTLTTPNLGTPSAATLTNATGLPVSTGISGLGTGIGTFLATPSSANLAAAMTDETGTGANVFANSPALTGAPDLQGTLKLSGFVTSTQITANQNNYAATDGSNTCTTKLVLRVSSNASRNISGLSCGQAEGDLRILHNVGAQNIVLTNADAGSTAANQFLFGGDITLAANASLAVRYDAVSSRWRAVMNPGAGGGGGGVTGVTIAAGTDVQLAGTCAITTSGTCTVSLADGFRQSVLLDRIYGAKAYGGIRRVINSMADGYKAIDGVDAGFSSGYSVNTSNGYVTSAGGSGTTGTFSSASTGGGGRQVSSATGQSLGFQFTAPATGTVSTAKIQIMAANVSGAWQARLYTNSGGSPGTQVGTASGNQTISGAGAATFTFGSPPSITASTLYWLVVTPASGSPDITVDTTANNASYGSGRNSTITAITGTSLPSSEDWRMEIGYTSTGDMIVVTTAQGTDASVSFVRVLVEYDPAATPTLNTDFTVEVTCNGGTNWASATLSDAGTGQGRRVAETADTACTAGTSFAARMKSLNGKVVPIYGTAITVR